MSQELSTNQRKAIDALLAHSRIEDAAAACGLHKRSLFLYVADPSFRDALREQQDKLTAATAARLSGGAGKALATLQAVMDDPKATAAAKVRAAVAWLAAWRQATELDDLSERISRLERGNEPKTEN